MESVKLVLRRDSSALATLQLTKGSESVLVGRSRDCLLRAPADEQSVSGKHARFFWKGAKLFIEDVGSRNGIFHDGVQVVKPQRVNYGDIFALGNCQIIIGEKEQRASKKICPYHRIEYLNGEKEGTTVDIRVREGADGFSIGLDPSCDINLPDMLVSRKHAVLKIRENDECWIEDLGSRNGTYVSGERLEDKSRLLKHGDKISIAYFDFRFLDRSVRVTRVHALRKLAVVAVTFCVVVAVYVFWMVRQPDAEAYIVTMRESVAMEDFSVAHKALEKAISARDAQSMQAQLNDLAVQLERWEKTCADWSQARQELTAGKIESARVIIDRLNASPIDAWAWKPETMASTRREVDFVCKAIQLYFDGRDAIVAAADSSTCTDTDVAVRAVFKPVSVFIRENGKKEETYLYLKPLLKRIRELQKDLEIIQKGFDEVDTGLARISIERPDFSGILERITRLSEDTKYPPAVREYARRQIEPCKAFWEVQRQLEKITGLLTKMDFDGVLANENKISLPSQEICSSQSKYSDVRMIFKERYEALFKAASELRAIVNELNECGVTEEGLGEVLTAFTSATNWKAILSFDCLKKRPPSLRRTEPSGIYDEMVGIEFTFESIKAMPNIYNGHEMRIVGFQPKCLMVRKAFERVETFIQYLDVEDKKPLQVGALGNLYTVCMKIAIAREEMVTMLKTMEGTKREKLVAAFYAEFFTARPSNAAKRLIESQFNVLKREVAELVDQYADESNPDRQILLRNKILETGLPGDTLVHTKWVQAFN